MSLGYSLYALVDKLIGPPAVRPGKRHAPVAVSEQIEKLMRQVFQPL